MNTILKYMFLCHRLPERSFYFKGKQFPICARCTGILLGYILGIFYIILYKNSNILIEFSLLIPIIIDGFGQLYGFWVSNNIRRFITGFLAGFSLICIFKFIALLGYRSGLYLAKYIKY